MVFMTVFVVVNVLSTGLMAITLRGKRPAPRPSPDTMTATQLIEPDDVASSDTVDQDAQSGCCDGREPVCALGQGCCELPAAGAAQLEQIRQNFLADVSHELKTPVGAVALLAEAVLGAAEDPHQVRWFGNKILHEANRLANLVSELIALSRLYAAERAPELTTVDVNEVIRAALVRSQLAVESANVQITVDAPGGVRVIGDATLLTTALSNLIDNAASYSPPGSPVLVSTRLADGFVDIAVIDQGRGIAAEHQQRVFERFFRVDPALSRSTGGTGLGLAIVQRVAINHGGNVQLRSKPGAGSTFILRIPAHQHSTHGSSLTSTLEYATAVRP